MVWGKYRSEVMADARRRIWKNRRFRYACGYGMTLGGAIRWHVIEATPKPKERDNG